MSSFTKKLGFISKAAIFGFITVNLGAFVLGSSKPASLDAYLVTGTLGLFCVYAGSSTLLNLFGLAKECINDVLNYFIKPSVKLDTPSFASKLKEDNVDSIRKEYYDPASGTYILVQRSGYRGTENPVHQFDTDNSLLLGANAIHVLADPQDYVKP